MTKDEIIAMARECSGHFSDLCFVFSVPELERFIQLVAQREREAEREPLEYWNAVEGWVKIDEVREHFDLVGCGTIYKDTGEDRIPLYRLKEKDNA